MLCSVLFCSDLYLCQCPDAVLPTRVPRMCNVTNRTGTNGALTASPLRAVELWGRRECD